MHSTTHTGAAVIASDVLDRIVANIKADSCDMTAAPIQVPAANFVCDQHAQREVAMLRRQPLVIAHRSELPEPGSFITRDVLGTPLLIVRNDDGSVGGYLNMCRHRGGKVELEARGNRRVFVCRYHGWSYNRNDGALRAIPYENFYGDVDHSCHGLKRVATEERNGFVWVALDPEQPRSVADYLGAANARMASFACADNTIFLERNYELDINWKLVIDGACDLLHPRFLHPETVGKYFAATTGIWVDYGLHGENVAPKNKFVEQVKAGAPLDVSWKTFSTNLRLFPNSLLIRAPDHIEFWTVWPSLQSASKCTVHIRLLVDPNVLDEKMTERLSLSARILEDAALTEDFPMEAAIQANSLANPNETFLYGQLEVAGQHFHRQLQAALGADRDAANND